MRKTISQLSMLSPSEYNQIVNGFNDTAVDYPKDKCVHTLFEEQVAKTPDKTAVIACDKTLTYKELNEQANRIAHSLIEKGVQANDVVAFMLPRRSYLLSVMFGILKSGAAYMPIDPDYPEDRIEYMLKDSGAKLCITEENIAELLENDSVSNPNISMSSNNLCYCIYTSGSTGKPKGTAIRHRNLVNFCNSNKYNNLQKDITENCTNVLSVGAVIFDIFLFETALSLLNGLTVILASENDLADINSLAALIDKYNISCFHCTPSKLEMYINNSNFAKALDKVKVFMLGGETLNTELAKHISLLSQGKIYNGYGPTETTMGVSFGEIEVPEEYEHNITLSQIEVISKTELKTVTKDFNNTAVYYPKDKCVHTLFEEQVAKEPNKVAVIACDRTLTYKELNEQANRIAHSLIEKGVQPNDIIAFMLPRKSYLLSVMFGILKSGAAYMPIDPDYPEERIEYMLKDSGAKFCITEDNIAELVGSDSISNPNVSILSERNYCVIYTSGSTGQPKGCFLKHKGIVNFSINSNVVNYFNTINVEPIGISINNVTFDYFIAENIVLLLNGYKTLLCSKEQSVDPKEFWELCEKYKVNLIQTTPTRYNIFLQKEFISSNVDIKLAVTSGEALTPELYSKLKMYLKATVFNPMGPTECSVWGPGGEFETPPKIESICVLNEKL